MNLLFDSLKIGCQALSFVGPQCAIAGVIGGGAINILQDALVPGLVQPDMMNEALFEQIDDILAAKGSEERKKLKNIKKEYKKAS